MYKVDNEALDAELGINTPKLIIDPPPEPELPKHSDRITMWVQNHKPHQKLPIVNINNELIWLNRATRRKLKSK